jgi:hypothetical protein
MDGLGPQLPHNLSDVVLLKKANRGNASRARIKASASVLKRNATQCKNGDLLPASITQSVKAGRIGLRCILLFENWREHSHVSLLGSGASNVGHGMTRNADQHAGGNSGLNPSLPDFQRQNIV